VKENTLKPTFSFRRTGVAAAAVFGLLAAIPAQPAHAYGEDTHYLITYAACRAVGFTLEEASTVAANDQGMDDSDGVLAQHYPAKRIPLIGKIPAPKIDEQIKWHAFAPDGNASTLLARKNELFNRALSASSPRVKLQLLGVFFHYQQDTWAHRHHPNDHPTSFQPYKTGLGHAEHAAQPDRPPFDPVCAVRCLEETVSYAKQFLQRGLGRQPHPMFANYTPANAQVDHGWNDKRKGKHFNQIVVDNSTPGRAYLTGLIRSQIDAYTNSMDFNPNFAGRYTADEADFKKVRDHLQRTCDWFNPNNYNPPIILPPARGKIRNLTTQMIEGWR
jgi:hypothetical protein